MSIPTPPHSPAPEDAEVASPLLEPLPWASYVAIGDSFTEGLWDHPSEVAADVAGERLTGWADRLAASLSARRRAAGQAPLRFANLAVRGKKLDAIAGGQLDAALELGPQLISIAGGGNDILRPAVDLDHVLGTMERAVIRARAAGVDVLLCTGFYVNKGAALKSTQGRTGILNASLWSMARRHGAYLVDTWELRPVRDVRLWADDRIHLRPDGHRRVADAALVALGLEPDDPDYATPLKPGPVVPQRVRAAEEARWLKEYAGPWVKRRLTGTSSGDGRLGKDQELREI